MNRWPKHKAYPWETAPFLRILLPFAVGILWLYSPIGHISLPWSLVVSLLALFLFVLFRHNRWLYFIFAQIVLVAAGYSLAAITADEYRIPSSNSTSATIACISGQPAQKSTTWKLPLTLLHNTNDSGVTTERCKAVAYLFKDDMPMLFQQGDTIIMPANWLPVKNPGNPFEFDYAAWCARNGILATQFCSARDVRLLAAYEPDKAPFTTAIHNWCATQLDQYITDTLAAGLVKAMLLGDEAGLDEGLRAAFTATGIVHVIAISGGNVMIFFTVISWLLFFLRHKKHTWLRFMLALPLVWVYVLMTGASPSAIRAAVMFSVVAAGITFQKNQNSFNQLLATAFLLLCAQPAWFFSLGFQFSFVAVLSLIIFYTPLHALISFRGIKAKIISWPLRKLWSAICASLAAELLTAPLVIFYFHTFPLLFLIANVLAAMFMLVILLFGSAILISGHLLYVPHFIGKCATVFIHYFYAIVQWLSGINPPSLHFLYLSSPGLVLFYCCIAGFGYFFIRRHKAALFIGSAALCLLIVLLSIHKWQSLHQQRIVIYNTPHSIYAERITGCAFTPLTADSGVIASSAQAASPAHIRWQAWQQAGTDTSAIQLINHQSLLMLNSAIAAPKPFHIDYVVVNYHGSPDATHIKNVFSPKAIIIGNNYSREEQQQWIAECDSANVHLHLLSRDGAWLSADR